MIEISGYQIALDDPRVIGAGVGVALLFLLFVLLSMAVRRAGRSAHATEIVTQHLATMGTRVDGLSNGQQQLFGGLEAVTTAQAQQQARTLQLMEQRLASVTAVLNENLQGSSQRTARSLGELQQRLTAIDKAQDNITKLSGDVLSLQDILSNKQTRGAFGEIQLIDIVSKALPRDSFTLQAQLPNGRRVDCLIHLPNPPGSIAIDAKFPLEAYEALRASKTEAEALAASRALKSAVRKHIKDIAERYILDGETADGALLFLPSEAVYAELHANHPEVVREGFEKRVWIVSPTTCMATLNTMRAILKDVRMREQAGTIRRELAMLAKDVDRLSERVGNLDRHFGQAQKDVEEIKVSAGKAGRRALRLDRFEFDEVDTDDGEVLRLTTPVSTGGTANT
ncbi:MAG: DNA recombination protein RmuC [Pseudomonadota bacterium]